LPDHVGETYRGHEGFNSALTRWFEPYQGVTIELEQIVGTGDARRPSALRSALTERSKTSRPSPPCITESEGAR
jgi:hypothetical protein